MVQLQTAYNHQLTGIFGLFLNLYALISAEN